MADPPADAVNDIWGDDPLGFLIAPTTAGDFIAGVYERAPLVVARADPDRFASLLSIGSIDRILSGVDLKVGQIDLANAARDIPRSDYLDSNGYIDRGAIARQYQGGATIILQQMHQLDPALARFCRALEHVFSCHIQTNIYLTPPSAQGFRTHYDNHDVLVLQVSGEKAWRLHEAPVPIPYRGERFSSRDHDPGKVSREFVMKAGDCAYIPRGLMHDAQTSGTEPSLHITVGLIVKTWAELMVEAVSEVALRDPDFRRSLPPGFARADFDRGDARAMFAKLVGSLASLATLDPALDLFIDTFIRSRAPDTRGALMDAQRAPAAADGYGLRPFTPWRVETSGEEATLLTAGGAVAFAAAERAALTLVLRGAPFAIAELPLAEESRADFIRRLQAYGVIRRLDQTAP